MTINLTLILQILVFAGLVWFTKRYVWPPLMSAVEERQAKISDGLAAAERGEQKLQQSREEADQIVREARDQAQQILNQANKRSTEMIEQARNDAQAEGERLINAARAEIDQEVNQARDRLRDEVAELAVLGASRIVKRELDRKAHEDLVEDLVAQI